MCWGVSFRLTQNKECHPLTWTLLSLLPEPGSPWMSFRGCINILVCNIYSCNCTLFKNIIAVKLMLYYWSVDIAVVPCASEPVMFSCAFPYFPITARSGPLCLSSNPLSLPQLFHFLSLSFFLTKSRDPPHFTNLPHNSLAPPMFFKLPHTTSSFMFPLKPSTTPVQCPGCFCVTWASSTLYCGWCGANVCTD